MISMFSSEAFELESRFFFGDFFFCFLCFELSEELLSLRESGEPATTRRRVSGARRGALRLRSRQDDFLSIGNPSRSRDS